MLVNLGRKELAALIKGYFPSYELMSHPLIKNKGQYWGGFKDEWQWTFNSDEYSEEQLWETYLILGSPPPKQDVKELLSANALYSKLKCLSDVTEVVVHDQGDFKVRIKVVGGSDTEIANIICHAIPFNVKVLGDYQVEGYNGRKYFIERK